MYIETKDENYIDDKFGKIPIAHNQDEIIIRFLNTNGVKKGKLKRNAFYPFKYPHSEENKLSTHRFDYSSLEYSRKVAISIFKENYRGLSFLTIKNILDLGCKFETCPEGGITQHSHIIYPNYKSSEIINNPSSTEITDLIEKLYQFIKTNKLFFAEKVSTLTDIQLPESFPNVMIDEE